MCVQESDWRPIVCNVLESRLRAVLVDDADATTQAHALSALCVLGGFVERLRAGGTVKVSRDSHTGDVHGFGTVVSYGPHLTSVDVLLEDDRRRSTASAAAPSVLTKHRRARHAAPAAESQAQERVVSVAADRLVAVPPVPINAGTHHVANCSHFLYCANYDTWSTRG